MKIIERKLKGIFEITSSPHIDERGYLVRLSDDEIFKNAGLNTKWVQESCSYTNKKYTIRGLHVSLPPSLEGKTITAIKGKVMWVVLDVRKDSETFGQWDSIILSEELNNTLCAQSGFAHGCLSLKDNCYLLLRADSYFSEEHGTGIAWNDKNLNIDWKLNGIVPIISERDKQYQTFSKFKERYGGV